MKILSRITGVISSMKWRQFFEDSSGALSSNRLIYLSWSFIILGLLAYLTIKIGEFPKIDTSLVMLYGSVVAGKVGQSFSENSTPTPPTSQTG